MAVSNHSAPAPHEARVAGSAGLAAGLAGIFASSCCVLPLVFAGLGLGSVTAAVIPTLAILRPYLLAVAVIVVALGWLSFAAGRRVAMAEAACAIDPRPRRAPLWLAIASVVVVLALLWQPLVEPQLLAWIR